MEILRYNHKFPRNKGQILAHSTKGFTILEAGTEVGVKLEVKDLDHTFFVILTPEETQRFIQSLLKKS